MLGSKVEKKLNPAHMFVGRTRMSIPVGESESPINLPRYACCTERFLGGITLDQNGIIAFVQFSP